MLGGQSKQVVYVASLIHTGGPSFRRQTRHTCVSFNFLNGWRHLRKVNASQCLLCPFPPASSVLQTPWRMENSHCYGEIYAWELMQGWWVTSDLWLLWRTQDAISHIMLISHYNINNFSSCLKFLQLIMILNIYFHWSDENIQSDRPDFRC